MFRTDFDGSFGDFEERATSRRVGVLAPGWQGEALDPGNLREHPRVVHAQGELSSLDGSPRNVETKNLEVRGRDELDEQAFDERPGGDLATQPVKHGHSLG